MVFPFNVADIQSIVCTLGQLTNIYDYCSASGLGSQCCMCRQKGRYFYCGTRFVAATVYSADTYEVTLNNGESYYITKEEYIELLKKKFQGNYA